MTQIPTITGEKGPYANYGANAANNTLRYFQGEKKPGQPPNTGLPFPGNNDMSAIFDMFQKVMSGEGGIEDIFNKAGDAFSKVGPGKPNPSVQYSDKGGDMQAMYADLFGYSSVMLKSDTTPKAPSEFEKNATKAADQANKVKDPLKALVPILKGFFPDLAAPLDKILNMDLKDKADQVMNSDAGKMFLGVPELGLATNLVDRNKDGVVDIAEKAAETLFLDDPVNTLKTTVERKLATLDMQDNAADYMALSELQTKLEKQSSLLDGQISQAERAAGITMSKDKTIQALVGETLDTLAKEYKLTEKAKEYALDLG